MLGIRISGRPLAGNVESGSLDWFFAACERLGVKVAMLLPRVDLVAGVLERHPGLTVVIDARHGARLQGRRGLSVQRRALRFARHRTSR